MFLFGFAGIALITQIHGLPLLARYLCRRVRKRCPHQETEVRAWLAEREVVRARPRLMAA